MAGPALLSLPSGEQWAAQGTLIEHNRPGWWNRRDTRRSNRRALWGVWVRIPHRAHLAAQTDVHILVNLSRSALRSNLCGTKLVHAHSQHRGASESNQLAALRSQERGRSPGTRRAPTKPPTPICSAYIWATGTSSDTPRTAPPGLLQAPLVHVPTPSTSRSPSASPSPSWTPTSGRSTEAHKSAPHSGPHQTQPPYRKSASPMWCTRTRLVEPETPGGEPAVMITRSPF
jgi:hypothetical protein